ncbi:MAG: hypothetical protein ACLFVJ_05225 [Persicimonas sp.]
MISWLTTVVIVLLAALLLWVVPRLAAGRKVATQSGELVDEFDRLSAGLGLGKTERRTVFGALVHRVTGEYNRLEVEVEVHVAADVNFTRITVEFPQTLDQDLTVLSNRRSAVRNWLLRQKETTLGVDEFDRDFILMARYPRRLETLLTPSIQFQLSKLIDMVDTLEVGDEAVFVMAAEMTDPARISAVLKKTLEISERIYATAVQLGPSPSKMGATVYGQASTGIYPRVEGEPSGESDESTTPGESVSGREVSR